MNCSCNTPKYPTAQSRNNSREPKIQQLTPQNSGSPYTFFQKCRHPLLIHHLYSNNNHLYPQELHSHLLSYSSHPALALRIYKNLREESHTYRKKDINVQSLQKSHTVITDCKIPDMEDQYHIILPWEKSNGVPLLLTCLLNFAGFLDRLRSLLHFQYVVLAS